MQRLWGLSGHREFYSTDWPTGRNTQTTGRSTLLKQTSRETDAQMITFSSLDGGTKAFSWKYRYEKINNRIPPSPSAHTKTRRFSKLTLFCFLEEWLTVESRCLFIFIWICEVILLLHPAAHSTSNVAMMNYCVMSGKQSAVCPRLHQHSEAFYMKKFTL